MHVPKTYQSDAEAKLASTLLQEGWQLARIIEAVEKLSQKNKPMIKLAVLVGGRTLPDFLMANEIGAAKLRSCCVACNCLDSYLSGEISQDLFPGHDVEVSITVEKPRNFPAQNRISEYRPVSRSAG